MGQGLFLALYSLRCGRSVALALGALSCRLSWHRSKSKLLSCYWMSNMEKLDSHHFNQFKPQLIPTALCSGKPKCHSSCEVIVPPSTSVGGSVRHPSVSQRFCWGQGPKNCQKMNKVVCAEQCDGGRCFGSEPNQCCHAQCAGGCNGPTKADCWVRNR